MRFIQEFGYSVKIGQDEAHQKWVIANDAALRAASPAGSKYLGTYAVVFSSEKQAGFYKVLMERASSQFTDLDLSAPWSNTLLKNVIDATVWDPKT